MAASSAFESSLRRGNSTAATSRKTTTTTPSSSSDTSSKRAGTSPLRRSRSVSAFSRTSRSDFSEFSIKRDNPLFENKNENDDELELRHSVLDSGDQSTSKTKSKAVTAAAIAVKVDNSSRRGRSISRNASDGKHVSGSGNSKEWSRSLSVVDTRRRGRSVSRTPVSRSHYTSESEVDQEGNSWMKSRNKGNLSSTPSNGQKGNLVRSSSSLTQSSQRKPIDTSNASPTSLSRLKSAKWDDVVSTSSLSEAELMESFQEDKLVGDDTASSDIYKTVKSEVRRAISDIQNELENAMRRSNATGISSTDVTDIPPHLDNIGAVEFVSDIQREYATKLEQSQERARQLRADLAAEEHRGMELSRILKEVLPDPKTPSTKKSLQGRKSSIERRKISKCLTEDALAYFDECVSLSTFDGSDFSSLEDPPVKLVGVGTLDGDNISLLHSNSSTPASNFPGNYLPDKQECHFAYRSHDPLDLKAINGDMEQTRDQFSLNNADGEWSQKFQFSFSPKPGKTCELQQNIRRYVKGFEKDIGKVDIDSPITRNSYDPDEYDLHAKQQSLLFDHVFYKNRIESGSLLLCNGGCIASSFLPFASVI